MADDGQHFSVLQDLQVHLRKASVPLDNLSTLAQEGDEKLVEQFLTENIKVQGTGPDVVQSQLYIGCFWGIRNVVEQLLRNKADPNHRNNGTLWTPLHAATFQEFGPIVMLLLEYGARPDSPDAENRTPVDFASASDKIWPHFAAMGFKRTSRGELVEKKVLRPQSSHSAGRRIRPAGQGIQMASYDRAEPTYETNSDPFIHAAVTGDVLADQGDDQGPGGGASRGGMEPLSMRGQQPQFSMWR